MTFRVGQKVTMIAPWTATPTYLGEIFTQMGVVYTVREILLVDDRWEAIRVNEIANKAANYRLLTGRIVLIEQPFPAKNFRPVVSRKTSIEIFTRMLNPSKQGIDA